MDSLVQLIVSGCRSWWYCRRRCQRKRLYTVATTATAVLAQRNTPTLQYAINNIYRTFVDKRLRNGHGAAGQGVLRGGGGQGGVVAELCYLDVKSVWSAIRGEVIRSDQYFTIRSSMTK